jgi:nitrogen fixation/metabolism regulation signal transduction histidine kinase
MGSSWGSSRAAPFAAGVAVRAALIGALAFAAVALAAWAHYYATAAILVGAALLVALDLARSATAADRTLAQFVDGLFVEGYDRPGRRPGAGRLGAAIDRALGELAALRAERQRRLDYLQALIDTVAAAVLVATEDGRIEFANRAAGQRLGEAPTLAALPALGPAAGAQLAAAPLGSRLVLTLADGGRALASVGAFASAAGPRRLVALQSLAADLDAAQQEAWRDLTRILAHEMMNSLTPICSLAESLAAMGDRDPAALAEAVEVIGRRSAHLISFVERYRRLAELPAPEREPIEAARFVAGLGALIGALAADRGAAYESTVEPPGLILSADPDLLEQAVINLLKNALDAVAGRPDGRVRLVVNAEDGGAAIAVVDNGPGLAPAEAEAAFTPFFTTKPGGAGIGLSLARQIALAHGGRLEHRPALRGGAVFRLLLPALTSRAIVAETGQGAPP